MVALRVARMTGRCATGAERDGGSVRHLLGPDAGAWGRAVCGAQPGTRFGNGWDVLEGAEASCAKCARLVARAVARGLEAPPAPRLVGRAYERATGCCRGCKGEGRVSGGHVVCARCGGSGKPALQSGR